MLDGNTERPSVQESYAGAVSSGNSRTEAHRTKPADLIASAGLSPYRMGTALMRLVSEWNSGAIPGLSATPDVKDLARQIAGRRVEEDIRSDHTDHGLTVSEKRARRAAVVVTKADLDLAHAELSRLQAQATDWQTEEAKLRFQRLKTLPTVRAGLLHWTRERWPAESAEEWRDAEHLVASVLRYFLAPKCPTCGGSGVREFAGNNRKGAGKPCQGCRDNSVRGELNVPHGGRGRALLAHMKACTGQAAADLREGAHRLRRSDKSEAERFQRRHNEKVEQAQRADAEAKVDEKADTAAVAAQFRETFTKVRKT